ncbi:MAG: methyltransferase domain-containing protein [Armatimonadetes bacterium]|nr:methyltransferase domain-containing protein [Armatimonadota bacterium]
MNVEAYAIEARVEETHWWFVGRRRLFSSEIRLMNLAPGAAVLDVGTSTGTNLRMLRELGFANVEGVDFSQEAIAWCAARGLGTVRHGDVCDLPYADASLDLVLATDILEHVEDDDRAAREIRRVLRPGGRALISGPAFRELWGLQDDLAHHLRRYAQSGFRKLLESAGFHVVHCYYFNFILFVPIFLARQLMRVFRFGLKSENQLNAPWMNEILTRLFAFDVRLAPLLRPPFGVSILAVVEKR